SPSLASASCHISMCLIGPAPRSCQSLGEGRMECNKNVTGTICEYGALSLAGEYFQSKQYADKHVLFVNAATH
uniref:Uncharacterized protein n=1 Tax=Prolemur simus TaxID=1328070 RepID=A0A8C8YZS3_PROSS